MPASDVRPINGIKTIIDLRSRDEQRKDFLHDDQSKQGHLIQHFTVGMSAYSVFCMVFWHFEFVNFLK